MRSFVYPNPEDKSKVIAVSIVDPDLDPLKEISPEGFFVNEGELDPNLQRWFECVEIKGKSLEINLSKAREKTRARLRAERRPLLEELDVQFQRSLEKSSKINTSIVAEKNRLRNITSLVDSCGTLEELSKLSVSQ